MEELQDAIEDAQYVNAISSQDDGPRPVLAWDVATDEQLQEWKQSLLQKNPQAFGLDSTLHSAIGMFLFSSFLKDTQNDYLRMNFCEAVIRWKKLRGRHRIDRAKDIIATYLSPPTKSEQGIVVLPKKTEIDEYDLARPLPPPLQQDLNVLYQVNYDASSTESCVGLKGPVLQEIHAIMATLDSKTREEQAKSTDAENDAVESPPSEDDDADKAEPTTDETDTSTSVKEEETKEAEDAVAKSETSATSPTTEQDDKNETTAPPPMPPPDDDDDDDKINNDPKFDALKKQLSAMNIDRRQSRARKYLPDDLFDKAEVVVMESLRREYWAGFLLSEQYKKMDNFHWYKDKRVVPEDFFILRVLGRGGFGLVTACKKGTSGKLYAMKVMNKRRIKMKKSEQLAINERAALAAVESPFVVNLKYSFHSKDDVFLILDLMTGGDLGYHLHQKGRFPKKECLYYAARIMLGLQALHDHRFVYRDLKPENCLLADDGRVRITDLGLATKITPTLHGAAGTRGYWAPEMLRRDKKGKRMPYGHTVDWFSFGCCLAEFISGQNPFRSETALNYGISKGKKGKEKAIDCATLEMDPTFDSKYFDEDAADLCRKLLDKDETKRLGTNGCEEIMVHPWFKDVNWEMILSDRKKPPYIPPKDVNAASQSEIGTFEEDRSFQETSITDKDELVYKDWDWTNPHAFAAEVIEFLIYERETGEPLIPMSQQSTCCCIIL